MESAVAATLTALASKEQPPLPTPPPASDTPVSAYGVSFTIPQGLAGGANAESVSASLDPGAPSWELHPPYVKFTLNDYILRDKFFQPQIEVYPAVEFSQANEGAARIIGELRALLANPSQPLPHNLPFLPLFNAGQIFHSNEQFIKFQNGGGIRYLTQFGQDIAPVNNHSLFYTFQGLTDDGAYYVSFILPVNASFLAKYPSPEYPEPADGIPFNWDDYTSAPAYYSQVTQKLNATPADGFSPSLIMLDTLAQSVLAVAP